MESSNHLQYSMADKLGAVCRKWKVVKGEDRKKLAGKLVLRAVGIKKHLFLGGYYRKLDALQLQQDRALAERLAKESPAREKCIGSIIGEASMVGQNAVAPVEAIQETASVEAMPEATPKDMSHFVESICSRGSYLALVVNTLDKGGLEGVVRLLAEEMTHRSIPVKVLVMRHGGEIAEELLNHGVEVLCFEGVRENLRNYLKEHPPILANTHFVSENLDVFRELGIPVVEVIHNMYVFLNHEGMNSEREKIPYINHYIAVSQKSADIYRAKFPEVSPEKISVIGNAFTIQREAAVAGDEIRASLGIPREAFVYITVGSIDARKNQIGILRAWDVVRQVTDVPAVLLIVGGGTDYEYEHKVEELVKSRGMKDVIFTGHRRDVYELLNASDVFLLDSYYEGWSIAATEALSCGLALIHADCGSGAELVAGGRNGILTDNPLKSIESYDSMVLYDAGHAGINENMEQLAGAMLDILENRELWTSGREARRQYAQEHFSSAEVIDKYLTVFEKVYRKQQEGKRME